MSQKEQSIPDNIPPSSLNAIAGGQDSASCGEETSGGQQNNPPTKLIILAILSGLALLFPDEFKSLMCRVKSISLTNIEFYPPSSEIIMPKADDLPEEP